MSPSLPRLKPWQAGLILGVALAAVVVLPLGAGAANAGEGRMYDLLLRCRTPAVDPRILLVGIDDATFKSLGDRMPNRAEYGSAVQRLWDKGASLIALDILFASTPREPAEDLPLEEALSKADTVLACNPAAGIEPINRFKNQAVAVGSIELLTDQDGVLRSLPPPYQDPAPDGTTTLTLPFALACARMAWFPGGPPPAKLEGRVLKIGGHAYPLGRAGWLIPYCGGNGTLPRLSMRDVLDEKFPLQDLKGKLVLVGSTLARGHDSFSVPFPEKSKSAGQFSTISTRTMDGIEIHGQALSALLLGQSITAPSPAGRAALFALVALAGTALTMVPFKPALALAVWLALGILIIGGALAAMRYGKALPLLALGLCWLAYAGASFSYHRFRDFQEKRAVQRLFARYVSPNVARELLINPDLVQLGGRRKVLTILFSDIRGFTNLSERIPPEQVSALLNEYFTVMTQVLFRYDGTLDKFIGDAVLAFFGDPLDQPDQSARALACAVAMQEEAAALRAKFEAEGKPTLRVGIAVHTGPVIVGNNGSETNFLYTVIGDTVNLTARLQGLAVKDDVITTVFTAERVPDFETLYQVEHLEPVLVKGKSEPIPILRVMGRA